MEPVKLTWHRDGSTERAELHGLNYEMDELYNHPNGFGHSNRWRARMKAVGKEFSLCESMHLDDARLLCESHANAVALSHLMPKWVSVKDRLPDELVDCLCFNGMGEISIHCFNPATKSFTMTRPLSEMVTHWQPLPPSPADSEGGL